MRLKLRAPEPSEDEIHEACARWLRIQWPQDPPSRVKQHGVRWITHELRNARDDVEGGKRKRRGCRAGDPDLQFDYGRCVFYIELKTRKGDLSTAQIAERERILASGGAWVLCRSLDDMIDTLRNWGFPLRGVAARVRVSPHVQERVT